MSRLKYFKGLSLADITSIVKAGRIRKISAGATITIEEEPCAGWVQTGKKC